MVRSLSVQVRLPPNLWPPTITTAVASSVALPGTDGSSRIPFDATLLRSDFPILAGTGGYRSTE